MTRYVALLRGVNVGGNNKIAMATLASLFSKAGCREVETYIQSGNVVFSGNQKIAAKAPGLICEEIKKQAGFETQIILRSLDDLKRVEAANPYLDVERLYVMFLADAPQPERVALLDKNRSTPDEFTVLGSEIYLNLVTGAAKTKLTNAYFDSKLKTVSTARNWRTVNKLLAMMAG